MPKEITHLELESLIRSWVKIELIDVREELIGKQIIGVVNFPSKQIGKFMSEFPVTGFYQEDGSVVLSVPDKEMENSVKLG